MANSLDPANIAAWSGKQSRFWLDVAFCGIWSGSSLFAQACLSQYLELIWWIESSNLSYNIAFSPSTSKTSHGHAKDHHPVSWIFMVLLGTSTNPSLCHPDTDNLCHWSQGATGDQLEACRGWRGWLSVYTGGYESHTRLPHQSSSRDPVWTQWTYTTNNYQEIRYIHFNPCPAESGYTLPLQTV